MRLECITAIERRLLYIWSHRDFAFSVKQQRSYPSRTAAFSQNAILQTRPDLLAMCLGVCSIVEVVIPEVRLVTETLAPMGPHLQGRTRRALRVSLCFGFFNAQH